MGAKCCASERAPRDPCPEETWRVDVDPYPFESSAKPLWLLQQEEAKAKAAMPSGCQPAYSETVLSDTASVTSTPSAVLAPASSSQPSTSQPSSRAMSPEGAPATPKGKAQARARSRRRRETQPKQQPSRSSGRMSRMPGTPSNPSTPSVTGFDIPPAPSLLIGPGLLMDVGDLAKEEDNSSSGLSAPPLVRQVSPPMVRQVSPASSDRGGREISYWVLHISIIGAQKLPNADGWPGKSDPYCVCEIPGKPSSKIKTSVEKDSDAPFWAFRAEMSGVAASDSLSFTVWDKDLLKSDDELGRAVLPVNKIPSEGVGFGGTVTLQRQSDRKGGGEIGKLELAIRKVSTFVSCEKVNPEVKEGWTDAKEDLREVSVQIISAKNLPNADWGMGQGLSDPYCICSVPGKPEVLKTNLQHDTLNPQWNFAGTLKNYCLGDPICFSVWDSDYLSSDDFLGRALLHSKALYAGGYLGELSLGGQATIKIKLLIREIAFDFGAKKVEEVTPPSVEPVQLQEKQEATKKPDKAPPHPLMRQATADRNALLSSKEAEDKQKMGRELLKAADKNDDKTFRQLLSQGASLETTNHDGMGVLHICVIRRNVEFIKLLLEDKVTKKKLLTSRTSDKDTALHMAARDGQKALCVLLVKEGASLQLKNAAGKVPADVARGALSEWLRNDPVNTPPPWRNQ